MNNQYDDARQDAARSTPEPDNEPLSSRAHGAASAPIGKRRRHLIVRGEMHTRHTARRKHGSIVYGVRRRIVVADMGLVRGSPRPRPYGGRGQADCSRKGGEEQS